MPALLGKLGGGPRSGGQDAEMSVVDPLPNSEILGDLLREIPPSLPLVHISDVGAC